MLYGPVLPPWAYSISRYLPRAEPYAFRRGGRFEPLPGGLAFPRVARGGGPVFGALDPFQYGSAVIDPGELFFAHGNPVGGPSQAYRGLSTATFPALAVIVGPGAPLEFDPIGIAGSPIGAPGRGGAI